MVSEYKQEKEKKRKAEKGVKPMVPADNTYRHMFVGCQTSIDICNRLFISCFKSSTGLNFK